MKVHNWNQDNQGTNPFLIWFDKKKWPYVYG
jgi:hypothetical protein